MISNTLHIFGFAGTALIVLAVFYPMLVYRGKRGERFSMFNHFISELGEVGVSPAAWAFNSGMLLSGLVLLPYVFGMGLAMRSLWGWLGTGAGIIAVLGVAAVGIVPMNNIKTHAAAAITYFRAGLLMVLFFGLAIIFPHAGGRVVPPAANLLSLLAFVAYGAFLTLPLAKKGHKRPSEILDPGLTPERPRVWAMAILEWLVFFSTIAWLFGMTFFV